MKYKLCVTPEAEEDLSEIFEWYENRRKGLGHDFLLQVHDRLRLIEKDPFLFSEQYKRVRRCLTARFPYKIFYCIEAQNIIIIAIVYGGRSSKWIEKRIKST